MTPRVNHMPSTKAKPAKMIRFKVGTSIGAVDYDVDEVAPENVMRPDTRKAWLEQGLIETVDD